MVTRVPVLSSAGACCAEFVDFGGVRKRKKENQRAKGNAGNFPHSPQLCGETTHGIKM